MRSLLHVSMSVAGVHAMLRLHTVSPPCHVLAGGRQPWDFGRFVKTVMFFNPPPQAGQVLQGLLSGLLGNGQQVSRLQERQHHWQAA